MLQPECTKGNPVATRSGLLYPALTVKKEIKKEE